MQKGADIVTTDETRKVLCYLRECFPRKFESKSTAAEKKRMMNSILKQWQKLFAKYSFPEVMGAAELYVGAYGGKYFPDAKEIFDLIRPDPLASFDRFMRWKYHMEDRTDLRLDQLLLEVDYLECRTRPVEVGDDAS